MTAFLPFLKPLNRGLTPSQLAAARARTESLAAQRVLRWAEDRGHYIGVLFEGCTPADIRNCHPTFDVFYLDEIVPVPKPTRSQRRYARFLDADCGATFGEWLKTRWARE